MATTLTLADFYGYVRENRKRIADIYREIEEIQYQFNELYNRQRDERAKLIASYAPLLQAGASEDLPPELVQRLEAQKETELKAVQEEIARLEKDTAEKGQKADTLIQDAQRKVAYLREQNPILNQQEEELKARRTKMQNELQGLDAELRRTGWFPLGWLVNALKRRRLHAQRVHVAENLQAIEKGIATVRQKWQAEKQRLQDAQGDLKNQWQATSVEASQLQARLEYLRSHSDAQSMHNAAYNLLSNLIELPAGAGPWEGRLSPLLELTRNKAQYESSLKSVAEILGMLKGLGEGMDRFIRSVATLVEEQTRYKLPSLSVKLPDTVTSFHAVWPDLQAKVKDEKYLGTHPVEFDRHIREIMPQRLSEAAIQKMFDGMGSALNQATKAWR